MELSGMPTYEEMFYYVRDILERNGGEVKEKYWLIFRKRSQHTRRTCLWLWRLICEPADLTIENPYLLMTAAIFHDSGYRMENNQVSKNDHGKAGAQVFRDFAKDKGFTRDQIDQICGWITVHSDKSLLKDLKSPPELVLLMEADLLDEEGALAVVCDCMAQGILGPNEYRDAVQRISHFSAKVLDENPMVTPKAIKYWEQKQKIVRDFLEALELDLGYPINFQ